MKAGHLYRMEARPLQRNARLTRPSCVLLAAPSDRRFSIPTDSADSGGEATS